KPMGKPKDRDEAYFFLKTLSGRTHEVITAFCLGLNLYDHPQTTRWAKTLVTFKKLSDEIINQYINSGSPFDKAGGYGYQDDFGKSFVESINGLESTIIGLPIELLLDELTPFIKDPSYDSPSN
ncbi:MAG: Maf family protein, partial [Bdellovibrionaceae bacterium]|nr:Maf family protein [Pseudobdellovibrionaceae bacterium]